MCCWTGKTGAEHCRKACSEPYLLMQMCLWHHCYAEGASLQCALQEKKQAKPELCCSFQVLWLSPLTPLAAGPCHDPLGTPSACLLAPAPLPNLRPVCCPVQLVSNRTPHSCGPHPQHCLNYQRNAVTASGKPHNVSGFNSVINANNQIEFVAFQLISSWTQMCLLASRTSLVL